MKAADQGIFFETSEEQIWKEQEKRKIVSGVCCGTLPSGNRRALPVTAAGLLDLVTVGGVMAIVPRWDASQNLEVKKVSSRHGRAGV